MRAVAAALAAAAFAVAAPAVAAPPASYAAAARVAHLTAALQAVRAAPPESLRRASDYARALSRGACSSGVARLKVECLMTAARRFCKRGEAGLHHCLVVMDVVAGNVLADEQWIAPERRYQIMRTHRDWRRALAAELRRTEGALAVDFHLREGDAADDAALARKIDHFCLASSDETNLAWQTCAATLVWFIEGQAP